MIDEIAPGFVDTNVLVYGFERNNSPKKQVAQRLLNDLMEDDRLRLSTQILQELSSCSPGRLASDAQAPKH